MLSDYFNFSLSQEIKSLIIIALPSEPGFVELEWKSHKIEIDIPPVYIHREYGTVIKNQRIAVRK